MKTAGEDPLLLNGSALDLGGLVSVARGRGISIDKDALQRVAKANAALEQAILDGDRVYGVTTGLGSKVTQELSAKEIQSFSVSTIRGCAHAIGSPIPASIVRAAMTIRTNTLLTGATGASVGVVTHLADCLNANLVPRIGSLTSIGPADLAWGGCLGLALVGEGQFLGQPTDEMSSAALQANAIPDLVLGPRDGLVLASHSSFSTSYAALALEHVRIIWDWSQSATALSLEAFRSNLSPFRDDVMALHPQHGSIRAARDMLDRLAGSKLFEPGQARRLQDPLSFRNAAQVSGTDCVKTPNLTRPSQLSLCRPYFAPRSCRGQCRRGGVGLLTIGA